MDTYKVTCWFIRSEDGIDNLSKFKKWHDVDIDAHCFYHAQCEVELMLVKATPGISDILLEDEILLSWVSAHKMVWTIPNRSTRSLFLKGNERAIMFVITQTKEGDE